MILFRIVGGVLALACIGLVCAFNPDQALGVLLTGAVITTAGVLLAVWAEPARKREAYRRASEAVLTQIKQAPYGVVRLKTPPGQRIRPGSPGDFC
jgi:hypothetical protein